MKRLEQIKSIVTNSDAHRFRRGSYSQAGEDLIVKFIFDTIGMRKPSYIDIGAHHPFYFNNTAVLYENGSRGINVEPDQNLFGEFEKHRKGDINLNCGVSAADGTMDLYVMNVPTMNTFSEDEAQRQVRENNFQIIRKVPVPMLSVPTIISRHCNGVFPDFLNLDIESLDEVVIGSIDFKGSIPTIICLETVSFSDNGRGQKNTAIIKQIEQYGYMVYADSFINTIFVQKNKCLKS
jgi:FkbM family methyltransferase